MIVERMRIFGSQISQAVAFEVGHQLSRETASGGHHFFTLAHEWHLVIEQRDGIEAGSDRPRPELSRAHLLVRMHPTCSSVD
jgi:hypothetical protein